MAVPPVQVERARGPFHPLVAQFGNRLFVADARASARDQDAPGSASHDSLEDSLIVGVSGGAGCYFRGEALAAGSLACSSSSSPESREGEIERGGAAPAATGRAVG